MLEIISDTQVHLQDSYEQRKNMKLNETYRKKIVYSSRLTERMNILNIQYSAKRKSDDFSAGIGEKSLDLKSMMWLLIRVKRHALSGNSASRPKRQHWGL